MKFMNKKAFAFVAWFLSATLFFAMCAVQISALADNVPAAGFTSSATENGTTLFSGISTKLNWKKSLTYVSKDQYTLTLTVAAHNQAKYQSFVRTDVECDYYVIPNSGYYLLELFGGNGSEGQNTPSGNGGKGGKGGHVYGYTYLTKGQIVYSTLGSNGMRTIRTDTGGGTNDGGEHGGSGNYYIGCGGGYSALYIFNDENTFKANYLNPDGSLKDINANDADRNSNYIMIAGGGGGGGAGNQYWLQQNGTADGGNGGTIGTGATGSDSLTNSTGSTISGNYFSGLDGASSGSSTAYVGMGGSNVPGEVNRTYIKLFWEKQPNNWFGTENTSYPGGSGGNSNLRGGAGGAGYCGGSGGIMTSLVVGSNVGGGGGGSSFIKSGIEYSNLKDWVKNKLLGTNTSTTGGESLITYLGTTDPATVDTDVSALGNGNVTGSLSNYFDITSISAVDAGGNNNGTVSFNNAPSVTSGTTNFSVSNAAILNEASDAPLTIKISLKAKAGFAGGNNVPVLSVDNANINVSSNDASGTTRSASIPAKADTDSINVPVHYAIGAKSCNIASGQSKNVSDLYLLDYNAITPGVGGDMFIKSKDSFTVYDSFGNAVSSSTVSPTTSTKYPIKLIVTPVTNNYAVVGPKQQSQLTIEDAASITVLTFGDISLSNLTASTSKDLSYNAATGEYSLSLRLKDLTARATNSMSASVINNSYEDNYYCCNGNEFTYTAKADGWYCVEGWGANGGFGGVAGSEHNANIYTSTSANQNISNYFDFSTGVMGITDKRVGVNGGTGGFVGGYIYLAKGETLIAEVYQTGADGTNNEPSSGYFSTYSIFIAGAGAGGKATKIYKNSTSSDPILIAGGGGGGAGGIAVNSGTTGSWKKHPYTAASPSSDDILNATAIGKNVTRFGTGSDGVTPTMPTASKLKDSGAVYWSGSKKNANIYNPVSGGAAGTNYINSDILKSSTGVTNDVKWSPAASHYNGGNSAAGFYGGAMRVKCVNVTPQADTAKASTMFNLSIGENISKYFTIMDSSVTVNGKLLSIADYTFTQTNNPDSTSSCSFSNIRPNNTTAGTVADTIIDNKVSVNDSVFSITIKPKDGFIGGNDVPVLLQTDTDTGMSLTQSGASAGVGKIASTDYANVAIAFDFSHSFVPHDKTITHGDSVHYADLYTCSASLPTGNDAWKADYVSDITVSPANTTVLPTATTSYAFTATIAPKASASKAVVPAVAPPLQDTIDATVNVNYQVSYSLTHMNTESPNPDLIWGGTDYVTIIKPEEGYKKPTSISVKTGSSVLTAGTGYTFDALTGRITIPAASITDNISIIAAGVTVKYDVHFVWFDENNENQQTNDDYKKIEAGGSITNTVSWANSKSNVINTAKVKPGYTFTWDWGGFADDSGNPPTVMPASDVYVYGMYTPKAYTLTANYVDSNGNALNDPSTGKCSYSEAVYYNNNYFIAAPEIAGYTPDKTTVSGKVGLGNINETITYTPVGAGTLIIYYVYGATNELVYANEKAADNYNCAKMTSDQRYSVVSPTVTGYSPDQATVSGRLNGTQGKVVYVRYSANVYTLTLFSDDGISPIHSKSVAYGSPYGFDAAAKKTTGLPKPKKSGYMFDGWYNGSDQVTEANVYQMAADTTLTAHWTAEADNYSVDIYWGALEYSYDYDSWNANSLSYTNGSYTPVSAGADMVTVYNYSSMPINASFGYVANSADNFTLSEATGKFRIGGGSDEPTSTLTLPLDKVSSSGLPTQAEAQLVLTSPGGLSLYHLGQATRAAGAVTVTIS